MVWPKAMYPLGALSSSKAGSLLAELQNVPKAVIGATAAKANFVRTTDLERLKILRTCSNGRFREAASRHQTDW
jgi:hypothetical protein